MKVNERYCSFYYRNDPITEEIKFAPSKTALMLIDLQNYFVDRPDFETEKKLKNGKKCMPIFMKLLSQITNVY